MARKLKGNMRACTRVMFSTRAEVDVNGKTIDGIVQDISMGGLLLHTDASVDVGDACEARIFLGDDDPMVMHALGFVARCDTQGFAVSFSGFYCDSESHLRQVVLMNADSKRDVEAEMDAAPKLTLI